MRVLLTGHDGYLGRILAPILEDAGIRVVGLDSQLLAGCGGEATPVGGLRVDVRDVQPAQLEGFDAVIHLAGLCNDALGELRTALTFEINEVASLRLARLAKRAHVPRFLFASSCSVYGDAGGALRDEEARPHPVTTYARSKIRAERAIAALADDAFAPTFLRCGTAYGVSDRLRGDLVVNNLVGYAFTTGEVRLKSDGAAFRPLVHVEDIARGFLALLRAPRGRVHHRVFNVGRTDENHRISDVAQLVQAIVPGSKLRYEQSGPTDVRNYRADCGRLEALPEYRPAWTLRRGIEELCEEYQRRGLTLGEFLSWRYSRIEHVKHLQSSGWVDASLRWRNAPAAV